MLFHPGKALACALACALAAVTLASALPAGAGHRPIPAELRGGTAGAILAGIASQQQTAPREPAWRHPHAYPRPSPDRVYFPPSPPRGASAG